MKDEVKEIIEANMQYHNYTDEEEKTVKEWINSVTLCDENPLVLDALRYGEAIKRALAEPPQELLLKKWATYLPTDIYKEKTCEHVWVDYGFMHSKFCCKICGIEKE